MLASAFPPTLGQDFDDLSCEQMQYLVAPRAARLSPPSKGQRVAVASSG